MLIKSLIYGIHFFKAKGCSQSFLLCLNFSLGKKDPRFGLLYLQKFPGVQKDSGQQKRGLCKNNHRKESDSNMALCQNIINKDSNGNIAL